MSTDRRRFLELSAVSVVSSSLPTFAFAQTGASPMMVTADSIDPLFNDPMIETNEERSSPLPHRYVHGSFKGTPGKFSFYFPPKERYRGRFYHNTYPLHLDSDVGPSPIDFKINEGNIDFAFSSGGYLVQTNQGGSFAQRFDPDPTISSGYRLNAAAAKFSRVVAEQIYGTGRRPYGYIHGGSGGSYQTIGCAENTTGVWDGFLPYVMGCTYALGGLWWPREYAVYVLGRRNRFPGVVDALDPGGSGDPYADLDAVERAALREAELMGFPPGGWYQYDTLGGSGGGQGDKTFVEDFWTKPGYAGADPNSPFRQWRVRHETTIASVTPGAQTAVELASVPDAHLTGSQLVVLSGAAAGKTISIGQIDGRTLRIGAGGGPMAMLGGGSASSPAKDLKPGDKVRLDNSAFLASLTYQRHTLPPSTEFAGWNQYRGPDGAPLHPQRPLGPVPSVSTVGSVMSGRITGKVLVMEAMMDIHAWPWQADWYRSKVKAALGPKFDDNFALWFIDNAQHDVPGHFGTQGIAKRARARSVNPVGALQQGLRDLTQWVERGIKPAETRYTVKDTQVHLPATARERGGIQPVVTLRANGGVLARVKVGEPVKFKGAAEVPGKAGKIVGAEWDFEGVGEDGKTVTIAMPQSDIQFAAEHIYDRPGTYFALLRAYSQREGDSQAPYGRVENLSRVRVVVT